MAVILNKVRYTWFLLVCRKTHGFCILILYPATLSKPFINVNVLLIDCSIVNSLWNHLKNLIISSSSKDSFVFPNIISFLFSLVIWLKYLVKCGIIETFLCFLSLMGVLMFNQYFVYLLFFFHIHFYP